MKPLDQVQVLLNQEMDRKQFLKVAGAATLGVLGVTKVLQTLSSLSGNKKQMPAGYGMSPYGK